MRSINENLKKIYHVMTLAAASVFLAACSNTEVEKTVISKSESLITPTIKTASRSYTGLEPQTVTDVHGNMTAVWEGYDGTRFNIWTMRRLAGENWSTASLLEADNSGDAYSPQVAVDGIGNVTAVWKQSDGKRFSVYANRFVNGVGWEGVKQIKNDTINQVSASDPLVTYDATGYAMVAWQEIDGLNVKTWINRHKGDAGWGEAKLLAPTIAIKDYPRFSFDASGLLTVIAQKTDS